MTAQSDISRVGNTSMECSAHMSAHYLIIFNSLPKSLHPGLRLVHIGCFYPTAIQRII